MVLELESTLTVCSWCGYMITENGIRKKNKIEKPDRGSLSNGICCICALKYFR